jgi:protein TonB
MSEMASAQTSYNRWDARPPAPIKMPTRVAIKPAATPAASAEVNPADSLAELATPRVTVEQTPVFPGGPEALIQYIKSRTKRLKGARATGTVYITFTVLPTGATSNVHVAPGRGISPSYDAAVVEVISGISNFSPGKRNGQPAAMEVTVPIRFD